MWSASSPRRTCFRRTARWRAGGRAVSRDPGAATRAPARTCSWSAPTLDINKTPRSQRLRRDFAGTPTSRLSLKAQSFTESVIREMTRLNLQLNGAERAVNFPQGFPDFNTDARILEAAAAALRDGYNQYAPTQGAPQLRQAVARKQAAAWGRVIDPETEVTVSCGATEAMISAMPAAIGPRHE